METAGRLRFKLDENADPRWRGPLEAAGHQVSTVAEENLKGAPDGLLARTCQKSRLCLITADFDFANIIEYPPDDYAGLIVLRHPKPTLAGMQRLVRQVAEVLERESPAGRLWIVQPGITRVRGGAGRPEV